MKNGARKKNWGEASLFLCSAAFSRCTSTNGTPSLEEVYYHSRETRFRGRDLRASNLRVPI